MKRLAVSYTHLAGPELVLLAEHIRALIEEGRDFDEVCEEMLRYRHHTHLLFSLESLANLARNGRVKPAVAAVARMLNIRVIGKASDVGELDVLCKTRGEHGALERIVLELKSHGYTNGKVIIAHCGNPAAAERLMHMVRACLLYTSPLTLAIVLLPRKPCHAPRTKTEGEKNIFY